MTPTKTNNTTTKPKATNVSPPQKKPSIIDRAKTTVSNTASKAKTTVSNVASKTKTTAKNTASRVTTAARNTATRVVAPVVAKAGTIAAKVQPYLPSVGTMKRIASGSLNALQAVGGGIQKIRCQALNLLTY